MFCNQATTVRSVCLLDLGAPPEYVPASRTNASGAKGTEAEAVASPSAEEEEEAGAGNREDDTSASTGPASSAPPDDAGQGVVSSSDGSSSAVPPESARAAPSTGAEVEPAEVAGAPALPEGSTVAFPAEHREEGAPRTAGGGGEAATATPVEVAVASAVKEDQEQAQEQEEKESSAYARASREFEHLGACTTPAEMLAVVKAGMTSLCDAAATISVSHHCVLALLRPDSGKSGCRDHARQRLHHTYEVAFVECTVRGERVFAKYVRARTHLRVASIFVQLPSDPWGSV